MGVCNCSIFCCTLLYVHSSIAAILMGKRELVALLNMSFWCLVMVEWLFLAVPWGCLWFVIVAFPDHTYLLFLASTAFLSHDFKNPIKRKEFGLSETKLVCFHGIFKKNEIKSAKRTPIQSRMNPLPSDPGSVPVYSLIFLLCERVVCCVLIFGCSSLYHF